MRYFGGKVRISKHIVSFLSSILENEQPFVDLFCGSCNIIKGIDGNRIRIANDINPYVIEMWKALQNGWIPPREIFKEDYYRIKNNLNNDMALSSFVGFGCSFAGKWWGGYAKSGNRNYCLNAFNSTIKKNRLLGDVFFYCADYQKVSIPDNSIIYCDIPYKGTTQYSYSGDFNHREFYNFVRKSSCKKNIYISEYKENIPCDFEVVWERCSKQDMRSKFNKKIKTIEVLIRCCG